MKLSDELTLSYYKTVADIDPAHRVQLVQDMRTGKFYAQKQLTVYNMEVFRSLQQDPIPQTPRICELAEDEGQLTVIEEYLSGDSLQVLLEQKGVFPEQQALDLVLQLCRIVSALHHRTPAIIHRDIKPSNLLLSSDGILFLLDFNAAKFSCAEHSDRCRDTRLLGTTGYAAPEQYGFGVSSAQADLYAIGVLLNVLLAGHLPSEQMADGTFASVITRCTKLDPADRYADVDLLIEELTAIHRRFEADITKSNTAYNAAINAADSAVSDTADNTANGTAVVTANSAADAAADSSDFNSRSASFMSDYRNSAAVSFRRFLPPGFRSGNPLHMLTAIIGYLMIFYTGCGLKIENASSVDTVLNRITFIIMSLFIVFFSCNYADIQEHFPPANSPKRMVRVLGIILYDFLFAILFLLILVIIENLFFS